MSEEFALGAARLGSAGKFPDLGCAPDPGGAPASGMAAKALNTERGPSEISFWSATVQMLPGGVIAVFCIVFVVFCTIVGLVISKRVRK